MFNPHDIQIPFSSFVLTSYARKAEGQSDISGERIRWLGVSMLGGNEGVDGPFELGIQTIKAVNDRDMDPLINGEWLSYCQVVTELYLMVSSIDEPSSQESITGRGSTDAI